MSTLFTKHYGSIAELAAEKISPANANHIGADFFRRAGRDMLEWYGVRTQSEAEAFLTKGWPAGVQRALESVKVIRLPAVTSIRRRQTWSDQGDALEIDRVYAGNLDTAWRSTRREVVGGNGNAVVAILVSNAANYFATAEELFWQGATAIALIEAIESSGRQCAVMNYSYALHVGNGVDYFATTVLKRAGEPLNLNWIAAHTCLAASFRWLGFRARMAQSWRAEDGLGRTAETDPPIVCDGKTIVVRGCFSQLAAQNFVNKTLEALQHGT